MLNYTFKMADDDCCVSCFRNTKYICLICETPICNACASAEKDDLVDGWTVGKKVGYCLPCSKNSDDLDENEERSSTVNDDVHALLGRESEAESDLDDDDSDLFLRKKLLKNKNPKKAGRKAKWNQELLGDLVDIIISDDYFKNKLIFTNTKNQKNGEIYERVLGEMKERATIRSEEVPFTAVQLRTKFKKAIAECKKTALTIKTSTGIKRFIDGKGYGPWFNNLFAIVKTRDACRPELAIEPSSTPHAQSDYSPDSELSNAETSSSSSSFERKEKVLPRNVKRKRDECLGEAIDLIKNAIANDPMKEMIAFMSEQAEKSREHEMKMMQILLQTSCTQNPQPSSHVGNASQYGNMYGGNSADPYAKYWY